MNWKREATLLLVRANNWWNAKDIVSQLYLSAVVMTLVAALLLRWYPEEAAGAMLARFAFSLFAIAYLREAYAWIVPKLDLPLVKLSLAALGVMAAATAAGVSRMVVNEATGQDPAHFGTTVALLVPVSFVPVVAVIVLIGGVILLPATMLWMLLHSLRPWATAAGRIMLFGYARAFAALVIVAGAAALLRPSSPLFPTIDWLARHSAHVFDAQPNSACTPTRGDRVLRINDDLVILSRMTADGPQFVRQACPLAAEDTPLRPSVSPNQSRVNANMLDSKKPRY